MGLYNWFTKNFQKDLCKNKIKRSINFATLAASLKIGGRCSLCSNRSWSTKNSKLSKGKCLFNPILWVSIQTKMEIIWWFSGCCQEKRSAVLPLSIQMMLFGWSNNLSHLALSNGWWARELLMYYHILSTKKRRKPPFIATTIFELGSTIHHSSRNIAWCEGKRNA